RLAAPPDAKGELVFIGDSVGAQWLPAIEALARQRGLAVVVLTKSACPIVDEPYFYERINQRFTICEQWRESAVDYVQSQKPELVVIGSSRYPFSTEQWRDGTRRILHALGAPQRQVVVIAPTPLLGYHNPICLISQGRMQNNVLVAPACTQALSQVEPGEAVDALRAAVESVPGTGLVYMNDLVCPDGRCDGLVRGHITFRDDQHLNAGFVEALAPAFAQRLEQALAGGEGVDEGVVE
ncbi:MAG TPA: SGNH hydrolase domain-containing protein, partial [Arenimonas sp.]|nr:SGNH hydrolase domain-containing protein [Arenimonas sp.]